MWTRLCQSMSVDINKPCPQGHHIVNTNIINLSPLSFSPLIKTTQLYTIPYPKKSQDPLTTEPVTDISSNQLRATLFPINYNLPMSLKHMKVSNNQHLYFRSYYSGYTFLPFMWPFTADSHDQLHFISTNPPAQQIPIINEMSNKIRDC